MKLCTLCQHAAYENAEHMIMACPHNDNLKNSLFNEMATLDSCKGIWERIPAAGVLNVILGGKPENVEFEDVVPIWYTVAVWVHKMYEQTITDRTGVG